MPPAAVLQAYPHLLICTHSKTNALSKEIHQSAAVPPTASPYTLFINTVPSASMNSYLSANERTTLNSYLQAIAEAIGAWWHMPANSGTWGRAEAEGL